jgi:5-methylcytosine-specific restriction endonuclease McrA
MCNNIKICNKHNIEYTLKITKNREYYECKLCSKEKRQLRYLKEINNIDLLNKKRERDRIYQIKKYKENPDVSKKNILKYKQSEKFFLNKIKKYEGKCSNIFCAECNKNRIYGKTICSECNKKNHLKSKYDFISICKHCNNEFGYDTKISNIGKIFQFNVYCSTNCNNESKKNSKRKNQRKLNNRYKKIKRDKNIAKKYGIKYEVIDRKLVFRKHNYICTSCGVKCVHPNKHNYNQSNAATLDHIIPKSKGGSHTYDNVTLLCRSCNTTKRDLILKTYKKNNMQLEIQFPVYPTQGHQLQLHL